MIANESTALRDQLVQLIASSHAHADFDAAVRDVPPEVRGKKVRGVEHTAWQLLEHMRIAQWDILEFSRNAKHVSPAWPDGYWPATAAPPDDQAWDKSVRRFKADRKAMQKLVADPERDLFTPLAHGEGQTLIREALLVADHNAYHIGQLVLLRRLLGCW
jgi:hypothetical protein